MLYDLLFSGYDARKILISLLMTVPIILISLTFHEVAHGYVSYKMGDPTAYNLGRLSLNPIKHLDPIGALAMLLFGIGWAKPVPVNSRYYKNPKWGMALTALAGPLANVLLAFVGVILYVCLYNSGVFSYESTEFLANFLGMLRDFLSTFVLLNTYLAIFNLIPIPPFDGSRLALVFLPDRIYFKIMRYERYIMLAVLALLWTGILSDQLDYLSTGLINGMTWLVDKVWYAVVSLF